MQGMKNAKKTVACFMKAKLFRVITQYHAIGRKTFVIFVPFVVKRVFQD